MDIRSNQWRVECGSMKTSRWKRHDEASELWIAAPKPVYGYWFRFLLHAAEDRPHNVDLYKYDN